MYRQVVLDAKIQACIKRTSMTGSRINSQHVLVVGGRGDMIYCTQWCVVWESVMMLITMGCVC